MGIDTIMKAAEVAYKVKGKPDTPETIKETAEEKEPVRTEKVLAGYTKDVFRERMASDIEEAFNKISSLFSGEKGVLMKEDALHCEAGIKIISKLLENLEKKIIPYANRCFSSGEADEIPFVKEIKKYTPRATWVYSKALQKKIKEIEIEKAVEKESGAAEKETKQIDVLGQKVFSIGVKVP